MADYKVTDTELTSIANAIRTKGGTQEQLEWPTGFVNAIEAIPSGGTSIIPGAKRLTPYATDNATGYINGTNWIAYQGTYTANRTDFYELDPSDGRERHLLIFVGSGGGSQFRIGKFATDPTNLTPGVEQTIYGTCLYYKKPGETGLANFLGVDNVGAYLGYIFTVTDIINTVYIGITKTNENVNGIETYVIDIDEVP